MRAFQFLDPKPTHRREAAKVHCGSGRTIKQALVFQRSCHPFEVVLINDAN